MILILISLGITAIATLLQTFLKMEKWKPRLIFLFFILAGLGVSCYLAQDNAAKSKKLQEDVENSKELLQSAEKKINDQSQTINAGFSNLKAQMLREGINNETILKSVKNLETNVKQLTADSKNLISEALGAEFKPGLPEKNDEIYIPLGNKNAVALDTKNQFAVSSDTPDENNKITVILNGRRRSLKPGEQFNFIDDQKHKSYLVYKGSDGKKMEFFVKNE